MSFAELASANIVGYQERAVEKSGWNLICNTFLPVNGDKSAMKLGDFTVKNWDLWNGDSIQFLDAGGGTATFEYEEESLAALFTYATEDDGAPANGWYQLDKALNEGVFVSGNDIPLEYGEGAVYQTGDPSAALVYSGAVAQEAQTILADKSGWNILGNPTPVAADFADITPVNWDLWNVDSIQFLDAGGGTASFEYGEESLMALFTYATEDDGAPANGWYQLDKALNEGVWVTIVEAGFGSLEAGESIVVQTGDDTAGIQFPSAL